MSKAYYNEFDPFAAAWLRELINDGLIAPGDVDERSITEVQPDDLRGYTQCHFFAGIGGWSGALRFAGWSDDRPVWTGSCPCQPFSAAGKRKGAADERHLWPEMRRLIAACRPDVVFGEQVASADGRYWLGGHPGLQRLQDREAIVGVLSERNLARWIPDSLQGMLQIGRGHTQGQDTEGCQIAGSCEVAATEPGIGLGARGSISGQAEGAALHAVANGDPADYRSRRVRDDRHPVQSGWRQDVGQPIAGPDRQLQGVHAGEHASGAVLHQCDGEYLGAGQDHRNIERDHVGEAQQVSGPASRSGIRIEAAADFAELAGVRADLEALGYAVGAADLCAAGVGAPHIRQRLWWVADCIGERHSALQPEGVGRIGGDGQDQRAWAGPERGGANDRRLGDTDDAGLAQRERDGSLRREAVGAQQGQAAIGRGDVGEWRPEPGGRGPASGCGDSFWSNAIWHPCSDGKARRVEPGIFPLAHGVPNRVGTLRGAGNAIVPEVAAEFIAAYVKAKAMTTV